jgi:16S rRNA G966 N2-methylase RsmD
MPKSVFWLVYQQQQQQQLEQQQEQQDAENPFLDPPFSRIKTKKNWGLKCMSIQKELMLVSKGLFYICGCRITWKLQWNWFLLNWTKNEGRILVRVFRIGRGIEQLPARLAWGVP